MHFRSQSQNFNNLAHSASAGFIKFEKKSNCANTITKFYNPEVEYVTKLKFYNPNSFENNTLYNLKKVNILGDQNQKTNTIIKFRNNLPKLGRDSNSTEKLVNSKFMYLRRVENMSYESGLEIRRKQLEEKLKDLKAEEKKLYHQLSACKKSVEDYDLDIEFLQNFYKYTGFEEKFNKFVEKKTHDNESYEKLMMMKKLLDMEEDRRNVELVTKKKEVIKRIEVVQKLRESIGETQESIKKTTEELENIKNSLLVHYHKLLAEGKDTRKEGLAWIIKAIWNLGQKVIPSYLPSFLDEKSISYLYNYASKDIDLSRIKKKLDDIHLRMRIKRERISLTEKKSSKKLGSSMNGFGDTQLTFKTELNSNKDNEDYLETNSEINKNIIKKLIEKYKKENHLYDEALNFKKIQEIMKKRGELGEEAMEYIKNVTDLEAQYRSLLATMQTMKKIEMSRINKEFYTNEYGRRFKISQEEMVSAMIGEDNTGNEIARQKREQNKYFQDLESIRTYNTFRPSKKGK